MKKQTSHSHTSKSVKFPACVLAAKESFKKSKNPLFSTIQKLTEQNDSLRLDALTKMWCTLEKEEEKKYGTTRDSADDSWVHYFLIYASFYSNLPPYFFERKSERTILVKDLKKHVRELTQKLAHYGFDYSVTYSEKYNRLSFFERMDYSERHAVSQNEMSNSKISGLLNQLIELAEKEINAAETVRNDTHAKARIFVYYMSEYLKNTYNQPLYYVLITATQSLYGIEYGEDEIRKILKRKTPVKDDDIF